MAESTKQKRATNQHVGPSRPGLVAALLLAVTVAGGIAAHVDAVVGDTPAASPGSVLSFEAKASGPVHLSGLLDRGSVLEGGDGTVKLELLIRADAASAGAPARVPTDLVVVLDRSGSMQGEPLRSATAAVRDLVARLGGEDRFAMVSYASQASVDVPLAQASPSATTRWLTRVGEVRAGGGTNMASGLDLAAGLIAERAEGRAVRVVLISDGHANEGDTSLEGLRARVLAAARAEAVLSSVGVGQGFHEGLMSSLADAGTGNFYYVPRADDLGEVFAGELASARETVASGLTVGIDLPSGVDVVDAAGYPLQRVGSRVAFQPGPLFAGQERRIWVTLRAPTATPGDLELGRVSLSYERNGKEASIGFDRPLAVSCVEQEADFYASVVTKRWARSKIVDDYNGLKQKLSGAIEKGEREAALGLIRRYRSDTAAMNTRLGSSAVARQLDELDALESAVDSAVSASSDGTAGTLGKKLMAEGTDGRRQGAKKQSAVGSRSGDGR